MGPYVRVEKQERFFVKELAKLLGTRSGRLMRYAREWDELRKVSCGHGRTPEYWVTARAAKRLIAHFRMLQGKKVLGKRTRWALGIR